MRSISILIGGHEDVVEPVREAYRDLVWNTCEELGLVLRPRPDGKVDCNFSIDFDVDTEGPKLGESTFLLQIPRSSKILVGRVSYRAGNAHVDYLRAATPDSTASLVRDFLRTLATTLAERSEHAWRGWAEELARQLRFITADRNALEAELTRVAGDRDEARARCEQLEAIIVLLEDAIIRTKAAPDKKLGWNLAQVVAGIAGPILGSLTLHYVAPAQQAMHAVTQLEQECRPTAITVGGNTYVINLNQEINYSHE